MKTAAVLPRGAGFGKRRDMAGGERAEGVFLSSPPSSSFSPSRLPSIRPQN